VTMETDSLLMDAIPGGSTLSHRRSSANTASILSRNSSRHVVRDSSDEELLDVNLPSPGRSSTHTDDRPHGTYVGFCHFFTVYVGVI